MTSELFREDAYLKTCEARVVAVDETGIRLDRTIFYPMGGGQPGDIGVLRRADGTAVTIADTRKGAAPGEIVHVPAPGQPPLAAGDAVVAELDWDRRYRHMRMHTCLHLLCAAVPAGVTGGQIGDQRSRLDFDVGDDEVEMHRRPVARVVARRSVLESGRARFLLQEVDRRRAADHLGRGGAEAARDLQLERVAIELDRVFEIVDVDIDEQPGHASAITTRRLRLPLFSIFSTTMGPISPVARTCVPPQGCRSTPAMSSSRTLPWPLGGLTDMVRTSSGFAASSSSLIQRGTTG